MLFKRIRGEPRNEIVWDDSCNSVIAPLVSGAAKRETPGTKYAGGHRIRVTPVPIPNTEVKPDTADGTVWETVWESRSLPALFLEARSLKNDRAFFVDREPRGTSQFTNRFVDDR